MLLLLTQARWTHPFFKSRSSISFEEFLNPLDSRHKEKTQNHNKATKATAIKVKNILNNWGLSFNFFNCGRSASFSFCADFVFHPWWWLLGFGIKCWEFVLILACSTCGTSKQGTVRNHTRTGGSCFRCWLGSHRERVWAPLAGNYPELALGIAVE